MESYFPQPRKWGYTCVLPCLGNNFSVLSSYCHLYTTNSHTGNFLTIFEVGAISFVSWPIYVSKDSNICYWMKIKTCGLGTQVSSGVFLHEVLGWIPDSIKKKDELATTTEQSGWPRSVPGKSGLRSAQVRLRIVGSLSCKCNLLAQEDNFLSCWAHL